MKNNVKTLKDKAKPTKFFLIFSDNFTGVLATNDFYQRLRLEMSSGDFGAHRAIELTEDEANNLQRNGLEIFDQNEIEIA